MCRRPTFFPQYKLEPLDKDGVLRDPKMHALAGYVNALADLAAPKAAIGLVTDATRLSFFESAVKKAITEQPGR